MSPGDAPARQGAAHTGPAPDTATSGMYPHAFAGMPPASPGQTDCSSLAHILDMRQHRPMLRLQALQIIEGICRGLEHSHANGCTHGDIQPDNIFVTAEGHVRLIGHRGTPTSTYASCEILEGAPPVPADDLFSAACVGYQLLAGELAFDTHTALEAETAARRPIRIPHLSPSQWRALDRALAFRRAERQPDIESFLNELRSQYTALPEGDAAATAQIPVAASAEPQRRLYPAVMAGCAVALLIALGWWLFRTPEAPVSAAPPPAETAEPETRLILRAEVAAPPPQSAISPTVATTPQAVTVVELPPPQHPVDPAPSVVVVETAPATVMPIRPITPQAPLIAPRPVAPSLPVLTAPVLAMDATLAADSGIYMVPFSSLKVRRYADPDYPRTSKGQRVAGWVDVSFGVDDVGRTTDLQVTAAEPAGLFEDAALSAVGRWRFAPVAVPAGSAREVRSEIRVRFVPD